MIVGNRKTLEEILEMIKPFKKVLLLGCNECVTVCATGGEREVGVLGSELKLWHAKEGKEIEIREQTLERQCDHEYIDQVRPFVEEYEVILSMACGAGVQYVKGLLDEVGLGGGRVEMYNMSSAQGQRFAEVAREMTEKIRGLGPSPVKRKSNSRILK